MCEIRTYRYQVRVAEDEISACAFTKTILPPHNVWAAPYGNSHRGSEYGYVSSWHRVELQVDIRCLWWACCLHIRTETSA